MVSLDIGLIPQEVRVWRRQWERRWHSGIVANRNPRRVRMRLTECETDCLLAEHPALPEEYLRYLREVGWGETPSGHMIYSGPISPKAVYAHLNEETDCVLIGDDQQGYCLAYDFGLKHFGQLSPTGVWSRFTEPFSLKDYLSLG